MKDVETYLILIARYLQNDISTADKKRLFHWIQENPENREVYDQMRKTWSFSVVDEDYEPDVEEGWQKFNALIDQPVEKTGYSLPDTEKSANPKRWQRIYRVAASIIVIFCLSWLVIELSSTKTMEFSTATGETKEILLPDSSKVWLNENSLITYAKDFDENPRHVELVGEAFFDVTKVKGKRFTVVTPESKIEVLGTSFNVENYPDEVAKVHVVTGRVAFTPLEKENYVYLAPGEFAQVSVTDSEDISKQEIQSENFQSWRNKALTFESARIEQLITDLEEYFKVQFEISNPAILNCQFTGQFADPSLSEVLQVLEVSMNVSIQQNNQTIILSGSGCQ